MRHLILAAALLLAAVARAEEAKPATPDAAPAAAMPAEWDTCSMCHSRFAAEAHLDKFPTSIHGQNGITCTDCHQGYSAGPHDGEVKLSAADQAMVDKLSKGEWLMPDGRTVKLKSPRALLACQNCHDLQVTAYLNSVHGEWLKEKDPKVAGPVCITCHGTEHALQKPAPYAPRADARQKVPADRREFEKRACETCHGNEEFAKKAGLNPEVAGSYHDSIHGRLARIGNEYAPTCVSCHAADPKVGGTHAIQPKGDPRSTVNMANRKNTCGRCHQGASDGFAGLIAHKPIQETGGHIVPHLVHMAFSWLTTLTLVFFALHVVLDFFTELRMRSAQKHGDHGHAADEERSVVRFDIHQRAQHWLMLSGVIILGMTGWPLRGAGNAAAAASSKAFLAIFGGAQGAALWHRIGAVLIIASSAYHLFYLTFLAAQKRLPISMLPMPKDALDMRDNILFMMGLRKERPKFDRYMYLEKFDYWAVFWGIVMMVGTGFMFWFPAFFAAHAPAWLITASQIIHGEEATLAITFLFAVHFYNVHLKPSIFPMNWAWLNGRISVAALKHEHPAEYERIKDKIK